MRTSLGVALVALACFDVPVISATPSVSRTPTPSPNVAPTGEPDGPMHVVAIAEEVLEASARRATEILLPAGGGETSIPTRPRGQDLGALRGKHLDKCAYSRPIDQTLLKFGRTQSSTMTTTTPPPAPFGGRSTQTPYSGSTCLAASTSCVDGARIVGNSGARHFFGRRTQLLQGVGR